MRALAPRVLRAVRVSEGSQWSAPRRLYEKVTPASAVEAQSAGAGTFVDVRPRESFHEVHAEGFTNIPHTHLAAQLAAIPKDSPVYLLDNYGFYSERAAKVLESNEYRDVRVIEGGLITWTFRGGPVTSANATVAARLKKHRGVAPSLPAVEAIAADHGVSVDISSRVFPLIDKVFDTPEDKKEAIEKSWARKK